MILPSLAVIHDRSTAAVAAGLLLTMLLSHVMVLSAEKYDLKPRYREGQRWSFEQNGEMEQSSTMTAEGQQQSQMQQRMRQTRKGTLTVLTVKDGLPASVRISFDKDCATSMEMGGQQQNIPFSMAGQTITVSRNADGQIQHDFKGQADPMALAELNGYLPTKDSYPAQPVTIGDQWQPDIARMRQAQQLGPQDRLEITSRLLSVRDAGGRKVAEVETTTSMSKGQGEMQMQSDMKGVSLVELATGNTLQAQITGTSSMQGTRQMPDYTGQQKTVRMNSRGSSQMRLVVTPQYESAANAVPTHAAPFSDDIGGAPPVPSDKSFAGTFTDGHLTITLNAAASGYTGSIQLDDQKFTLVGHVVSGRLEGSFESQGQKFAFTATLDGSVLTLTSDDRTYTLRKRAANPLAGSSSNPLSQEPKRPPNPISTQSSQPVPQRPPANPAAGAPMRFTRLSVKDPGINNIEAVSFLIPAGWKAEGGIQWFPDFSIQAVLLMKVTDPQTNAVIEFLPIQNFTWLTQMVVPMQPGTNYMGNIIWPPITDVPQFIQAFYAPNTLRQLQNARMVTSQDLPAIAALVEQTNTGATAKAGRVRYEYQVGGQTWEEEVYVTLSFFQHQMGTLWSVTSAYSFRAPKGQLDRLAPVMNTTISTSRLSLDWYSQYQFVQKLFYDRMRQGIRNAGIISDTITRNNEEIRQMFADSYRRSCESQDRISQHFTEYIRGVDTYHNPYEDRPVQLPSGYTDAWVTRSGDYILSSEAGYNPNIGSNIEWRRLEKGP